MTMLAMFQAPAQGVNWLSVFAQNLSDLTTQNGGVLTSVGMSLLSFVAIMMLVQLAVLIEMTIWTSIMIATKLSRDSPTLVSTPPF